jgi:hypothetical protein
VPKSLKKHVLIFHFLPIFLALIYVFLYGICSLHFVNEEEEEEEEEEEDT